MSLYSFRSRHALHTWLSPMTDLPTVYQLYSVPLHKNKIQQQLRTEANKENNLQVRRVKLVLPTKNAG